MKLIVQKFGGTSVAQPLFREKVVDMIIKTKESGFFPVVVVSALRYDKCPYSTDALLKLAQDFSHMDCREELDLLSSCGETIACPLVSMHIMKSGHSAKSFTGFQAGIITDEQFGHASIKRIETDMLRLWIDKGVIPVVAGFQGVTHDGNITTLGRGGSDTTAVALGHAFGAERVEFYKEVDGIMTSDPYIVPSALKLDEIGFDEIGEMTCCGSKVLESTSVEMARRLSLPLVVKNTFNPESSGTFIGEKRDVYFTRPVTSIAHISNVAQIHIDLPIEANGGKIEEIFNCLSHNDISLDFIALNPNDLLFIVDMKQLDKTSCTLEELECSFKVVPDCSKISAVGAGMRGMPGVMNRAFSALRKEGIKVLCSTDSHITIAFLVQGQDEKKTINALHKEFIGGEA